LRKEISLKIQRGNNGRRCREQKILPTLWSVCSSKINSSTPTPHKEIKLNMQSDVRVECKEITN